MLVCEQGNCERNDVNDICCKCCDIRYECDFACYHVFVEDDECLYEIEIEDDENIVKATIDMNGTGNINIAIDDNNKTK